MVSTQVALKDPTNKFSPADWESLPQRQKFFIAEYLVDFNATRAARAAGYKQPQNECVRLLENPKIAAAVEYVIAQRQVRTLIRADDVLKRWFQIATADPSELISYKVECCRHCWGIEHRFQWNEREFQFACEEYDEEKREAEEAGKTFRKRPPDERGGFGFRPDKPPNPECPKCMGRGVERTVITPTDQLSPQARLLFAGIKQTKEGIQVLMQDQARALENVARHLGMFASENPAAIFNNTVVNNNSTQVKTITRRIVDPQQVVEGEVVNDE